MRDARINKHARFQDGGIAFYMDGGCLLIKAESIDYPFPLTPQATHQLLNLLFVHRQDIIEANVEARQFGNSYQRRKEKYQKDIL